MLVLFETPAGYSLFKVSNEQKFLETDAANISHDFFKSADKVRRNLQLSSFEAFEDTAAAVAAATASATGKVSPSLAKFLKKKLKKLKDSSLVVADKALAVSLKDEKDISQLKIMHDSKTQELYRGIRTYMEELFDSEDNGKAGSVSSDDFRAMQLGLSHSMSRYKLKFSADKVDTMVIQAVGLLDELDKEVNTYAMRCKEWYGWHFPELHGLLSTKSSTGSTLGSSAGGGDADISANIAYAKLVLKCGLRSNYREMDLSDILQDELVEAAVKQAAEVSMGTEIADMDVLHIQHLAEQVVSMTQYRSQLFEYLKNRMMAIAPNLTIMVGELVGARLISHAGSLLNLAKQPASTVQILGAEKALFRALKTKHDTPKYGLIYHASLVGQAAPKNKGKISRVLAAKSALAIRVDALTENDAENMDDVDTTVGYEGRAKVEARLRQLEGGTMQTGGAALTARKTAKYDPVAAKTAAAAPAYNEASDMVLGDVKQEDSEDEKAKKKKAKKEKKKRKRDSLESSAGEPHENGKKKKDKKRKKEADSSSDDDKAARKAAKKAKKAKKEKRKSKG